MGLDFLLRGLRDSMTVRVVASSVLEVPFVCETPALPATEEGESDAMVSALGLAGDDSIRANPPSSTHADNSGVVTNVRNDIDFFLESLSCDELLQPAVLLEDTSSDSDLTASNEF